MAMSHRQPGHRHRWHALKAVTLVGVSLAVIVVGGPIIYQRVMSAGLMYRVDNVPVRDVALILGAEVQPSGRPSPYLAARLDLGVTLLQAGKVRAILVSGDNGEQDYNEPEAMRRYLISKGVPDSRIVLDYAGFDTYASCMRADRIFGTKSVIVVSQSYHLARAIATCRALGLDAVGVGDDTVRSTSPDTWRWGQLREIPAAVKMAWELITNKQPLLGPRESSLDLALGKK
jgi:vancomycin permeability regulator SanA